MKKAFLFAASAAVLCSCSTQPKYVVEGDIAGLEGTVYLFQQDSLIDSAVVKSGKFRFSGPAGAPAMHDLLDSRDGQPQAFAMQLILEPGTISIKSDADDPQVRHTTGTPANDAFGAHLRFVNRALHAYNFEDHDQAYRAALLDSLIGSSARNLAANTDNIFGVAMVDGVIHYDKDISRARVDSIVSLFPPHLRTCRLMKRPLEHIERVLRSRELARYVDFTANDAGGNPVTLSQVMKRSRYLLLDFWFADCVPCRSEMPHIRTAYEAYHDKGFEVVGLSTDKDAGAWKKAIAEDGMAWINLTDADRRVCDLYSVTKFPTNYLIDCSTGEVVARELRGKALAETLGELFKQ